MKSLKIHSCSETMTIEPIDSFRTVSIHLKNGDKEWNNFIIDTENMQQIIDHLVLQLKRSKMKRNDWNKQRINKHTITVYSLVKNKKQ